MHGESEVQGYSIETITVTDMCTVFLSVHFVPEERNH
jgi:hypothetical protein